MGRPGKLVPGRPALDLAANVLATPEPPLASLDRIVPAPVFAPDGSLVLNPGYHPAGRIYYAPTPGLVVPSVPDRPTDAELAAAVALYRGDLFGDFPFEGDADRAHVLALALTPYLRDLIDGPTPLYLIQAPTPGTGKTLLAQVALYPFLGAPVAAMAEGRDEEEWRKRVTAALLALLPVVLIDNLRLPLAAASVSAALTSRTWSDRVLGVSEVAEVTVRNIWVATANNPTLSEETARRTISARLDARCDRPWRRDGFRHADLIGWADERRGDLIAAALTIGRAWLAAGRPKGERTLGMFESWSAVLGSVLEVAGVPGFLDNLDDFYAEADAEGEAWRAFLGAWREEHGDEEVTAAELLQLATETLDLGEGGERSRITRLGRKLGESRDRQFGDLRLERPRVLRGSNLYTLREVAR